MAMAQYGDSATGGTGTATPVAPPAPTLPPGIGNDAQVNQANQFLRAQPWYQQWLQQNGQLPNNVHLTKDQAFQLLQLMRQKGVGISTAYSVDSSGNIVKDGMSGWEKAAIVAGIVVAGVLVAPAIVGALGVDGAASTGAAAAAGDAGAAATLGGGEAGATAGISPAIAAGTIGTGATVPALAATATVPTAASTIAGGTGLGDATLGGVGGATGAGSAVGTGAAAGGSSIAGDILRYGVPTAGGIVSGLIQANATSNASAAQQAYLQEALDYEKQRDAAAIALEGSRYADYSGNVAPFIARGNASGTKMSSLLGLPSTPTTTAPTVSYGPSATSTGTGQPTAPVTTGPPLPRATSQLVTMQAPDGTTKQVPQDQVQHYQSMGAQVVG